MTLDLMKEKGIDIERQQMNWRDIVGTPFSKLNDDAYTRVRTIFMNGIEAEAKVFQHTLARHHDPALREVAAKIRRNEHFQQTMVNWLLPADQSPLETTIGYEQVAVEVTASLAKHEPDPYLSQVLRFGLLEDFDHLYRYAALLDRLEGKDANTILQSYTDIRPGRPTAQEFRAPVDDLRRPYDRRSAQPISKLNSYVIMAAEQQTMNYYMNVGPTFADPMARMLYAEIASIEEQHVTHYESVIDPNETILEKWLLHEAAEVYSYYSCFQSESNPEVRRVWEMMLQWELGHLNRVMDLFRNTEKRDPAEVLPQSLPTPIEFTSQRDFVRETLSREVNLRAIGTEFVDVAAEKPDSASVTFRKTLAAKGAPSEIVAASYRWTPGGEIRAMQQGGAR